MSEKTVLTQSASPEVPISQDGPAAVFQDRVRDLTRLMPEHSTLLHEAGARAQGYADTLGENAAQRVEDVAGRFHISAEDSLGSQYADPAPQVEVERVTGYFRKNHHLNPEGPTFQRVKKTVTQYITNDRRGKIETAKEQIEGFNDAPIAKISDEGKEVFAEEAKDEYWRQATGLLSKLEDIAGTDVASARDKGVILSGVAIRRKIGPLHKYMNRNDRHRHFDSVLRNIVRTELSGAARDVEDSLTMDKIRQRFPQINPDSAFWQSRIQAVTKRLKAELSTREYMPLLSQSVAAIAAQAEKVPRREQQKPEPSHETAEDRGVDGDIRRLQAEGLSTKAIYRHLAQKYHPDTSGADEGDRFSHLSEWYRTQQAGTKTAKR